MQRGGFQDPNKTLARVLKATSIIGVGLDYILTQKAEGFNDDYPRVKEPGRGRYKYQAPCMTYPYGARAS